ncbi:MAG TPA: response regulator [Rariglobus sp.]
MKVLIVDDNDNCLQLLRKILDFVPDAQATSANSGCEAWWHLSDPQQSFDLLIADVNMPMVDGLTLTQRIRATPALKDLRIILCSALNDRKTVESFQPLGISHYVVKPYGLAMMLHKITLAMAS